MVEFPSDRVFVQEVAPRDGLQIEKVWVDTAEKIRLIDACADAGISRIEASSFVSPAVVPTLRDAEKVFAGIRRRLGVIFVALVPNLQGAQRAIAARADELNLVVSSSQMHNRANMRMSCEESLAEFREIAAAVRGTPISLNGTVATAFGCPFEGAQPVDRILRFVSFYLEMGASGVTLADTTGTANPRQARELVRRILDHAPASALTLHFHNTRGMGLANVLAAYSAGARRFDASVGGLGGCPFAPGASGNICTEDLVNMCEDMGVPTGIDLLKLITLSRGLPALLGHDTPSQVAKAGRVRDLHPKPVSASRGSLLRGSLLSANPLASFRTGNRAD
jgi:hydroxymethylglutaryl-CoA lyase